MPRYRKSTWRRWNVSSEARTYQADIRKRLRKGEPISQEETSILVDQFMIDQSRAIPRKRKPMPKHRHRWARPYLMGTVGWVKACRAKDCPRRMKAVRRVK